MSEPYLATGGKSDGVCGQGKWAISLGHSYLQHQNYQSFFISSQTQGRVKSTYLYCTLYSEGHLMG